LGGPEQLAQLTVMQQKGQLGCFALTEKLAGVNSGLVVQTTATWDKNQQAFILNSPTEGSHKNWISQGLTATKAAVIADLRVDGKSYGPHGFLVNLRDDVTGNLMPSVTVGDMGRKTTGNDLDNAWIKFDRFLIHKSSLLNRYGDIVDDRYVQKTKEKMRIEIIGQRLLTGRIAIAQAALQFCMRLYEQTRFYTQKKKCWSPGGEVMLGSIPHIAALYTEADQTLAMLHEFCLAVERELSKCLTQGSIPNARLVEAVAVAKIAAVENAILLAFRLKQEVGSYALMGGTGFEHLDFLTCCKFAEVNLIS
jgi:acyl-CoA oxidase